MLSGHTDFIQKSTSQNASQDINSEKTILFNISKKELYTPTNGFKSFVKKLKRDKKVGLYLHSIMS